MPWSPADAPAHTRAANTAGLRQLWATVANNALRRTGDDAQAIREANAAVHKARGKEISHRWLVLAGAIWLGLAGVTGAAWAQQHPAPNNGGGMPGTQTPASVVTPPFMAPAHNWLTGIGLSGWSYGQPGFSDLAGSATTAQLPALAVTPHYWVDGVGAGGWIRAQPATGDLSDITSFTLNTTGSVINTPTLSVGTGSWQSVWAAAYRAATASGAINGTNGIALPSGNAIPINYLSCADTLAASGGSQANPRISDCEAIYSAGVGSGTGDRAGLEVDMSITGTAAQTEGDAYFNGISDTVIASSNLGGVLGTEVGDVYGFSAQTALLSGATHYASVHGAGEFDLQVDSGASVANKFGLELALVLGDAVQGSNMDVGLLYTDHGGVTWNYGIEFGLPSGQGGQFPVSGTLIGSYAGNSSPVVNVAYGINFSNIAFSAYSIAVQGFGVDGNGHLHTPNAPGGQTLSTCGTSPTFDAGSSDTNGIIIVGSGTVTQCTINFAKTFTNAPGGVPNCHFQSTGNYVIWWANGTATSVTFASATSMGGAAVLYQCWD